MGRNSEKIKVSKQGMIAWIIVLTIAVGVLMILNIYYGVQVATVLGPPAG